ncbi:MAG: 2Fe-2S iron-sulfur cluster-binding protein [Pseudobdellovibrionaceae bacterium]
MKVKFIPQNIEVEVTPNKSLLQVAQENNVFIKSLCKGLPSCAECRVKIVEGEHNVIPPSKAELNLIGTNYFVDHRRLSCQIRCFGDVTVDLTEQTKKQDAATKKPRGFKSSGAATESHAVQDTIMLAEGSTEERTPDQSRNQKKNPQ